MTSFTGRVVLVDAANVVGSRPTGWWRDRAGAAEAFVDRIRSTPDAVLPRPVVVVLEGQARRGVDEGTVHGVEVVHASGEGDDAVVELARRVEGDVVLVSADRRLRDRVQELGGQVVGPSWLLDRLPA